VTKPAGIRPGTVGPTRDEERPPSIICFSVYGHSLHITAYGRGYAHYGYRDAGVGTGRSKEGLGSEV